jgi:hypothetical protein
MVKIMKKVQRKSLKPNHKGGAVYTFNLEEKIGGLPSRIPLNGTQDGDCPASDVKNLGMVNYGAASGGARKHRSRNNSKGRKNSSRKHKSHKNNFRNNKSRKHRLRNNKNKTRKNNSRNHK